MNLSYIEKPKKILKRSVKELRNKSIPMVKVITALFFLGIHRVRDSKKLMFERGNFFELTLSFNNFKKT
jgi:hypothetical protein